jgi:hypothetical protein
MDKVAALRPEQAEAAEAFIDGLSDQALVKAAQRLSELSFAAAWDNDDDAIYDEF